MQKLHLDKDELEQNIEFCDNLQGQKKRLLADMSAYEKKIAEYSKGIRELYMDKVKGLISESDFVELSKDFTTEKRTLRACDDRRPEAACRNRRTDCCW